MLTAVGSSLRYDPIRDIDNNLSRDSQSMMKTAEQILGFWFSDRVRLLWFAAPPELDEEIRAKYMDTFETAAAGQLADWGRTPEGALALVIVLDQFPLNMFRGRPESFATETAALVVAKAAIDRGFDNQLNNEQKTFLYLPFMHSENLEDQNRAVELYKQAGLNDSLIWARHHRAIVERFGRFPHRNAILGRESSPQELAWLAREDAFKG